MKAAPRLRRRLRSLRAQGRYPRLISLAATLNYRLKNARDLGYRRRAVRTLDRGEYGDTPHDWVSFAMTGAGGFFKPIQNPHEIEELVERLAERRPSTVVEIGTAKGGTLFLLCRAAAPDARVVSVDLPYGRNGGGFPRWKRPVYKRFTKPDQQLTLIAADSHLEATRDEVSRALGGEQIDVLFIDADHSYEGVKRDFELYSGLVADDGLIVLHDILPNRFDPEVNVDRFWAEVRETHRVEEIVNDPDQGVLGLGIVHPRRTADSSVDGS